MAGETRGGSSPTSMLPAVVVASIAGVFWYALNWDALHAPPLLGWIAPPVALILAAVEMRRTAEIPELSDVARRFWRELSIVPRIAATGSVVQVGSGLIAGGSVNEVPVVAIPIYVAAVLYTVWALVRLPLGQRQKREWVPILLDSATVVLGVGVFMWYVAFSPLVARGGTYLISVSMVVAVIALVALSAVVNIVLTGAGPVDSVSLRLLGVALLIGSVGSGTTTVLAQHAHLIPGQLCVPLLSVFCVLAARRQRRAVNVTAALEPAPRNRTVSLLPYLAVAATDVLLVLVTVGQVPRSTYVVIGGVITITALVAVRQVVAFGDNARLVNRLQQQEDELRHQASHDTLTQLANRALFAERLDDALSAGGGIAVLLIDLDDFKSVNDTMGHSVGDRLLAAVAEPIRRCVRPEDTVARLGGDEFAVLLRAAYPTTIDSVVNRIHHALSTPVAVDGSELLVQASIGIAVASPGDDAEAVLRNADIAMYAAKERGKGSFARYVPGMAARILHHAQLGAQLRQGIEDSQLHVLYQPIVRLRDKRIIGMEALVRWQHPVRGLVLPSDFIPTAERTGLIVPLGRWVLEQACHQLAAWQRAYGDAGPVTVGVNVSGRQLQERTFVDEVASALADSGLSAKQLVLEVTESAVLSGGQVLDTLHDLRDLGAILALDDFGTGQSSLGLIRTCPVHILKLDKSFVLADKDGSADAEQQSAIATAVVHIADALGMDAVAEGIETQAQADRLWALGYRLGQGFHFARPASPVHIERLLSQAG